MATIYENIKNLCAENNITLSQLERACDIGNGVISYWKNGDPSIKNVMKVSNYFGVTVESLIGKKEKS